ncbi:alpha-2-macroglobulin family protein [Tenacibaculum skagerrakense]|uniref:Alpha-2-macroglobulin family protein n=1 Tax=Tenacibaculum skagerrakense TaxID=186571 RepID=A0A4R2NL22_9FLAO|nr:MG2 domain-containing protein [Tenacibaculum skagerrakense]TCP22102.1 alpha-2-macroglobulin family protein [Tenacibaculum skagerrakense]
MKKKSILLTMLILFSVISQAQNKYPNLWKKVEDFEKEALPKSALKIVEEIYKKATADKNSPQLIKCLVYKSKLSLNLEENVQLTIINEFKEHITNSSFPTKNILQNMLANLYWQYFEDNRYGFYNRTNTDKKVDPNDFRTWDLTTLFKEIHTYYQRSLEDTKKLQKINIRDFKDILVLAEDSEKYRPTLYDLLAQNTLQFYTTDETNITKPAYQFKIDTTDYICEANLFTKLHLQTKDSLSLQFNALKIYQELTLLHQKEKNIDALVDVDLQRLAFVNKNATYANSDNVYLETLKSSENNYQNNEARALYSFEIASIYNSATTKYTEEKNENYRFKNKEALAICEQIKQQFPKSLAAKKASILSTSIQRKDLSIIEEQHIPIDKFSRILLNYKNINQLYFSIYNVSHDQYQKFEKTYDEAKKLKAIQELEKVTSWNNKLPNEQDYLEHSTEIIIPKLQQGTYLILASEKEQLDEKNIFGHALIQVTNLTFITTNETGKTTYQVLDRNNGKPIYGAKVQLVNKEDRYQNNVIDKTFTTDKNGEFSFSSNSYYYGVKAIISHKNDKATFGEYYLRENRIYNSKPSTITRTFLFTDRSIYRPGQILHFKGISLESLKDKSSIITNQSVEVILKDVNYQEVEKVKLTTNEFGSFSGKFTLPNTGLTGNFTIEATINGKKDYQYISVEEYKRPKFETKFKPVTETYQLNNKITVTGFAKAYSGANITDAKVVYRVHRKVIYPRWCYWYYPYLDSEPQEIINGETKTNEKGEFEILFKALPDESVAKEKLPVFNYEVTADIIDLNGETRSSTTIVKVGYHSLLASIESDDSLDKDEKNQTIQVSTKNLNGEPVNANGTITIYKLEAPENPIRKRPWKAPFYQTISEKEFRTKFPNEAYKNEDDYTTWEKGTSLFSKEFTTNKGSEEITLPPLKKWKSGKYIIELSSRDKFNQLVTDKQFVSLFSNKDELPADNKLVTITTDKEEYQPGETAVIKVASNSKDITVMVTIEKDRKVIEAHYIHLNKNCKTIKIPVTKEDVGGFGVRYHFVNYNSFKSQALLIVVPYPKTDLEIITKTFRNKLQPGANETWSFTVKGAQKDKVAAELLAGMYDASLDQFKPHNWNFNPIAKPTYSFGTYTTSQHSFGTNYFRVQNDSQMYFNYPTLQYDQLNWFGFYFENGNRLNKLYEAAPVEAEALMVRGAAPAASRKKVAKGWLANESISTKEVAEDDNDLQEIVVTGSLEADEKPKEDLGGVQIRKNLQETAFFYPHLSTDANGDVSFNFTIPEALTKWKLQLLAHSKNLHSVTKTLETVTQKELMVVPNAPRFLREKDEITFSAKISNLTEKTLSGTSQLLLTDAISGKSIDSELSNTNNQKTFTVDAEGNTQVSWNLKIPATVQAVQYQVIAKAEDFSDGEQNVLPVLSNRMLVTETLPMWVRSNQSKTFTLNKLKNNNSSTLKHHKLSLEVTSNPTWYAVQALPYLMEYPYDCAEQTFARYYANTLATFIANSNPKIQNVFNQWKSSKALLSNLEKNQELKSLIIQETPWLRDAQSESEQKKRIALLFDLNTMKNEQQKAFNKLQDLQMNNGGFPWFKGSRYPNPYITNYIVSGFGHLDKLEIEQFDKNTRSMLAKAVKFLDNEIAYNYEKLLKRAKQIQEKNGAKASQKFLEKQHIGYFDIQYLYMRSFYENIPISGVTKDAVAYYQKQAATYWKSFNLSGKGWIALTQFRDGDKSVASKILKSLKENSINSEELGMYWKENTAGWYWHQAPIETQALLIEAFSEIENDTKTIDDLKVWLLKNKQVSRWKTTKATSEAVYALLLQGSDWLASNELVTIKMGDKTIDPTQLENSKVEAGTGYFKTSWNGSEISSDKATVTLTKKDKGIVWGGLYWQYFEDLDKITSAKTPLQLSKKLFKKVNSDTGKKLLAVSDIELEVGDLVTVRIELKVDRDMEFIHMKDMRASAFEPIDVISQYKWQDGLGYYQSTKDAATNFFFDRVRKGVYVFEYDVRVNNKGNFSNGITTIQSMYAPEFSSHSEGVRVKVK